MKTILLLSMLLFTATSHAVTYNSDGEREPEGPASVEMDVPENDSQTDFSNRAPAEFVPGSKDTVILFGGYRATTAQMQCWQQGAEKDQAYASRYNFRGIPWPVGLPSAPANTVVSGGARDVQRVVDEINRNTDPNKKFYIVGHSSGSALATAVASRVKDPSRVELINLDGFVPSRPVQNRVKTTCWSAANNHTGQLSMNGRYMPSCINHRRFQNTTCRSAWCLHFALVNRTAPADLSGATFARAGYQGCATNLSFLPPPVAPQRPKEVAKANLKSIR